MEEDVLTDKEENKKQTDNRPWLYKKGQSGNPNGRPKGSISMKVWLKNRFNSMTDEEREEYCVGIDKLDLFKMAEGNPDSKTEGKIEIDNKVKAEDLVLAEEIKKLNARFEQSDTRTSEQSEGSTSEPMDTEVSD